MSRKEELANMSQAELIEEIRRGDKAQQEAADALAREDEARWQPPTAE